MDKLYDTLFFIAENPNQHPSLLGVQSYFVASVGAAVTKNKGASETDFSQKAMKNVSKGAFGIKDHDFGLLRLPKSSGFDFQRWASAHFVMQKLFNVQKEKFWYKEHGLDCN